MLKGWIGVKVVAWLSKLALYDLRISLDLAHSFIWPDMMFK